MEKLKYLIVFLSLPFFASALCTTTFATPLDVDQAFKLTVKQRDSNTLNATWNIAKGYHLYKDQVSIELAESNGAELGNIVYPPGKKVDSESLGDYVMYEGKLSIDIPVIKWGKAPLKILFKYQGCKGDEICYPPVSREISIKNTDAPTDTDKQGLTRTKAAAQPHTLTASSLYSIEKLLKKGNLALIILSFFVFGMLLSLTPCVLPMVPIIVGIILGQKDIKTFRAFVLSFFYVLGIAVTYTIAGVITATLGSGVQGLFQSFWVILAASLIFVLLALSLFGLYTIQLPSFLVNRLSKASSKTKGGTFIGVFLMGAISSLIVSPCVSAPLAGALIYIASTGNVLLGGTALFSLSIGMGVLLIIAGTTGGKLFIKSGSWMKYIKYSLGIIMMGISIWLISRVIPEYLTNLLWAILVVGIGLYMGALDSAQNTREKFVRLIAFVILLFGVGLFLKTFLGTNMFNYEKSSQQISYTQKDRLFNSVVSTKQLQKYIDQAISENKPVLIDYYADWCIICKKMDLTTFRDPEVRSALKSFIVLKADITKNTPDTKELKKKYNVFAPPHLVFLDTKGDEIKQLSSAGEVNAKTLLNIINQIKR